MEGQTNWILFSSLTRIFLGYLVVKESFYTLNRKLFKKIFKINLNLKFEMPKKSSIALFIAATSALSISSSVNSGENDMGGLKEWNTDMDVNADFILDDKAQEIGDKAKKSDVCIPIGEGENCW